MSHGNGKTLLQVLVVETLALIVYEVARGFGVMIRLILFGHQD